MGLSSLRLNSTTLVTNILSFVVFFGPDFFSQRELHNFILCLRHDLFFVFFHNCNFFTRHFHHSSSPAPGKSSMELSSTYLKLPT